MAVYDSGLGTIEDCDIFGNSKSGVWIVRNGNPVLRRCKIHDSKDFGMLVCENGKGTIEDCEIFRNVESGLKITEDSAMDVRNCKIDGLMIEVMPSAIGHPATQV